MHDQKGKTVEPTLMALDGASRRARVRLVGLFTLFSAMAIIGPMVCAVSPALADDSIARYGAGGIELVKSNDIRMLEEVLEISPKSVRVRFRFLNESDNDIHATVAFPLPPYPPYITDGRSGVSDPGSVVASFKVQENGRPVQTEWERKAVVDGKDITAKLRKLGLSDEQIFEGADLRGEQEAAALTLGGGRSGNKPLSWKGEWKVAETKFWRQTFPAGKEIVVEHSYEPAVGSSFFFGTPLPENRGEDVCLDDATRRGIDKQIKALKVKRDDAIVGDVKDVEYILGTGRNWKGPIRDFTLRIAKETPGQIVSLCFPGKPKKVCPTVIEFHQKNFVPPKRLLIYFYTIHKD